MPVRTLTSPETQQTKQKDKTTPQAEMTSGSTPTAPPPPYVGAQVPQTRPDKQTQTDTILATQRSSILMSPLVVIKNGLLQTAPYSGDINAQVQDEEYLDETARRSSNPLATSTTDTQVGSAREESASTMTCTEDTEQVSLTTRSQVRPSEHEYVNASDAASGGPSVQGMTSLFEQVGIRYWKECADQSQCADRQHARPTTTPQQITHPFH